uniref:Uncharacterized protein n=1 Tax=Pithovirus LCPAC403 TaxID=2506596 RepID=A0A481ZBZ6_9VIRU|nr:MAG: hypothetical protein LCPAC403_03100 [Pithovirus LCPAC403]
MAVYQVFNNDMIGLTTNLEKAKEFLKQVEQGEGSSGGIYLLKFNEMNGGVRSGGFLEIRRCRSIPTKNN